MNEKRTSYVTSKIEDALLDLMREKAISEITISELVNKADVARVSFYRNFTSIYEVLDNIVNNLFGNFLDRIVLLNKTNDEKEWRDFIFDYVYNIYSNRDIFQDVLSVNISIVFSLLLDKRKLIQKKLPDDSISDKYGLFAKLSLINGVIISWLENDGDDSPEDLVNYIMNFVLI